MADETNRIEVLEAEIKSMTDTQKNLIGLVQKLASIQANLSEAGFQAFSDSLSDPFSALSNVQDFSTKNTGFHPLNLSFHTCYSMVIGPEFTRRQMVLYGGL